jgi:hypothetical protein
MSTTSILDAKSQSRVAKWGWGILMGASVLLMLAGASWYFSLPQMLLENIAEYATLEPGDLMQGKPSAFDIISLIARGYGAGYAALGLLGLLVSMEGYRNGTRWAWTARWVLVAIFVALAGIFLLPGDYAPGLGTFALAVVALVGMLLARRGLVA